MSAESHLAQYAVTLEQARAFIISNLDNLPHIIDVCAAYGVTNQMLADIYDGEGGVSASQVIDFFAAAGLDSSGLDQAGAASTPADSGLSALTGTWYRESSASGFSNQRLTLNADGTYQSVDFVAVPTEEFFSGLETGTLAWNSASGALTVSVGSDGNGSAGLSHASELIVSFGQSNNELLITQGGVTHTYVADADRGQHFAYSELAGTLVYTPGWSEETGTTIGSLRFMDEISYGLALGVTETPADAIGHYTVDARGFLHLTHSLDALWNRDTGTSDTSWYSYQVAAIHQRTADPYPMDALVSESAYLAGNPETDAPQVETIMAELIDWQPVADYANDYFFYDAALVDLWLAAG